MKSFKNVAYLGHKHEKRILNTDIRVRNDVNLGY
jgi:hypothetical protein